MININDIDKERLKNIIKNELEYWLVDDCGNSSVSEDCFKNITHYSIETIIEYLETLND